MNAAYLDFARALELVCRHLNPPHRPLPVSLSLAELDLKGARLSAGDKGFAYRYLRGLEMPGKAESPLPAKTIWMSERGLLSVATAAAEIEPGMLAIGDPFGVVRVFVRAPRARWECVAALLSHQNMVCDILPLKGGGFATAGADGRAIIHQQDVRGHWRMFSPGPLSAGSLVPWAAYALCQLGDGTVIAAGQKGNIAQLSALPSGDWQVQQAWLGGSEADIIALASHAQNGYCTALRGANPHFWFRTADHSSRSLPAPGVFGIVNDVVRWGDEVIACTEAGEIVTFAVGPASDPNPIRENVERVAGTAMRAIRVIDNEHIVTWSDDNRMRIWARESGRFALRAALEAPRFLKPCLAPLCDGRVAFSETRGFVVATPQVDGTWRSEEVVSTYGFAVNAIAPFGSDRVAFVDAGTRLRILRLTNTAVMDVVNLDIGDVPIVSLAVVDIDALAIGCVDGTLRIARERGGQWQIEELSFVPEGSINHLSASGTLLASSHANGVAMIWRRRDDGQFELQKTIKVPALSALSIHASGRFAIASVSSPLHISNVDDPSPPITGPARHFVALQWRDDGLLAVDIDGQMSKMRFEPSFQEEFLHPPAPELARTPMVRPALAVFNDNSKGDRFVYAHGTGPIEIEGALPFNAMHSDVRTLAASNDVVYAGGDALYVFDMRSTGNPTIRRIVVTDEVVLEALLNRNGMVKSAQAWRRDPSATWNITAAAGKSLPNDPLLHTHIAVIEPGGHLGEVSTGGTYFFRADRRMFQIEDPETSD